MRLGVFVCDGAGVCGDYAEDLPATKKGKGRYSVKMPNGQNREFWVLWVDEGFRTAVLGNKQGDFRLDRGPQYHWWRGPDQSRTRDIRF